MKKRNMLLVGAAAAVLTLASCKSNPKTEEKNEPDKEALARQQEQKQRAEDEKFFEETRDALLKEYGYNSQDYNNANRSKDSIKEKLCYLEHRNYQCFKLNDEVDENLVKIGEKYAQKIENMLTNSYQLSVSDEAREHLRKVLCDAETYKDAYISSRGSHWNMSSIADDLDGKYHYSYGGFWSNVDIGQYGEIHQKEIKDKTLQLVKDMFNEQDSKRLEIAKNYAVYYPTLDRSKIPEQYRDCLEKDPYFIESSETEYAGYDWLYVIRTPENKPIFRINRSVSVYDSKLPVEFFNEEGASYKLNQVKPGQWQVEKKSKNGKTSKTPVFNDNVEYAFYAGGEEKEFEAVPGTNVGMKITVCEKVFEIPCKDDHLQSVEELKTVRSSLETALKLHEKIIAKQDSIWKRAEDEAQKALDRRIARRDKINTTAFNSQKKGGPKVC